MEDILTKPDLEEKIAKMQEGGAEQLIVVSDYDRTLTDPSASASTSFKLIDNSGLMPGEYVERKKQLYRKFKPMETDLSRCREERRQAMTEWWNEAYKALIEFAIEETVLKRLARDSHVPLRKGAKELFKTLDEKDIPLIIYSAGMGDLIAYGLEKEREVHDNITIISNFFEFKDGRASRLKGRIINNLTKFGHRVRPYCDGKKNVVLLGDLLEDLYMTKGVSYETQISAGILNHRTEKHKDEFCRKYDIVIPSGGSLDYITKIIERID